MSNESIRERRWFMRILGISEDIALTNLFGEAVEIHRMSISGVRATPEGTLVILKQGQTVLVRETAEKVVELWFQSYH